jgi:hypothetical protein
MAALSRATPRWATPELPRRPAQCPLACITIRYRHSALRWQPRHPRARSPPRPPVIVPPSRAMMLPSRAVMVVLAVVGSGHGCPLTNRRARWTGRTSHDGRVRLVAGPAEQHRQHDGAAEVTDPASEGQHQWCDARRLGDDDHGRAGSRAQDLVGHPAAGELLPGEVGVRVVGHPPKTVTSGRRARPSRGTGAGPCAPARRWTGPA